MKKSCTARQKGYNSCLKNATPRALGFCVHGAMRVFKAASA